MNFCLRQAARRAVHVLTVLLVGFFLIAVPAQAVAVAQAPAPAVVAAPPIPVPNPLTPLAPGGFENPLTKIPIPTGRDCLNPPLAANPSDGLPYAIDPGPKTPVAGDPFDKDSKATMYDRYGYAGYKLNTFEIPNKMDICQPINVDPFQANANMQADLSLATIAVATRLTRLVTTGTLGSVWDPLQEKLTSSLGGKLFVSVAGFAAAAAAIWVLWTRGRKGHVSAMFAWVGSAMLILAIAVGCVFYTVTVGASVDQGTKLAVQSAAEVATAGDRDPADVVGNVLVDRVMFPTWQKQTFGQNTAARDEFQARLWKASNFTREEQAELDADVAAAGAKINERQEQYKTVMLELRDKYPTAYPQAAGQNSQGQVGEAAAASLSVASAAWFLIGLLVLLIWASVIARIGIGIFPAVAIPAVFPKFHGLAIDVGTSIVMAAWQAVISAFAIFIYLAAALVPIMGSDYDPFLKTLMIMFVSFAMSRVMKRMKVTPRGVLKKMRVRRKESKKSSHRKTSGDPSNSHPGPTPGNPGATGTGIVPREARQSARPAHSAAPAIAVPNGDLGDLGDLKSTNTAASKPVPAVTPGRRGEYVPTPTAALTSAETSRTPTVGGGAKTVAVTAAKYKAITTGATAAAKATPHGRVIVVGTAAVAAAPKAVGAVRGIHQKASETRVRPPIAHIGSPARSISEGPVFRPGNSTAAAAVIPGRVIRRGHHTPTTPTPETPAQTSATVKAPPPPTKRV